MVPTPVLYLDVCAINRLTDDHTQPRLHAESAAMTTIFTLIQMQQVRWIASTLLVYEISRNPNQYKRAFASSLLPAREEIISPTARTIDRANQLLQLRLNEADALHLALAEQAKADSLITTDDGLLRRTSARTEPPECINPVDWLRGRKPWLLPNR